ncbi:MAG: hypothetical protein H6728_12995 [Myxococcales bacterium]|nr:hypothetical protein [Myxococcales bacterium]MCB9643985.1 hypothetical protein [Myxococcales bacterium]
MLESGRPSRWQISLMMLQHQEHFFRAIGDVVREWPDTQRDQFAALIALLGNMLWARSTYDARDKDQEQLMAYAGATAGTFASQIAPQSDVRGRLENFLDSIEQRFYAAHDALVALLETKIQALPQEACTPGQVQAMVWETLFADIPYGKGTFALQRSLETYLRGALGAQKTG